MQPILAGSSGLFPSYGVHDRLGPTYLPPVWDILLHLAEAPDRRDQRFLVSPLKDTDKLG